MKKVKYTCGDCGKIITAYKRKTLTRRKCSKCGSYRIKFVGNSKKIKDTRKLKEYPFVSLIVVNYNGKSYLKDCFNSLAQLNYPKNKMEFIMVDNCSVDNSIEFIKKNYPSVSIIRSDRNSYARANNLGIMKTRGKFVALLSNDVKIDMGWLIELIKVITNSKKIGAVGSKILLLDGRIQSVGQQEYPNLYWGDIGFHEIDKGQYEKIKEVESINCAAVLFRKECLEDIGLLDEDFTYLEDIDLAIRCKRRGWKMTYVPSSIAHHRYSGTSFITNPEDPESVQRQKVEKNRLILIAKYFPDRLAESISTSAFFYIYKKYDLLYETLPLVFKKLLKENDKDAVIEILPNFFSNLRKIVHYEKDVSNIKSQINQELLQIRKKLELKLELKDRKKDIKDDELRELRHNFELVNAELEEEKDKIKVIEEEIKELRYDLEFKKDKIKELSNSLEQNKKELERIKDVLRFKDNEIKELRNSRGYRFILEPLDKVYRKIIGEK